MSYRPEIQCFTCNIPSTKVIEQGTCVDVQIRRMNVHMYKFSVPIRLFRQGIQRIETSIET